MLLQTVRGCVMQLVLKPPPSTGLRQWPSMWSRLFYCVGSFRAAETLSRLAGSSSARSSKRKVAWVQTNTLSSPFRNARTASPAAPGRYGTGDRCKSAPVYRRYARGHASLFHTRTHIVLIPPLSTTTARQVTYLAGRCRASRRR